MAPWTMVALGFEEQEYRPAAFTAKSMPGQLIENRAVRPNARQSGHGALADDARHVEEVGGLLGAIFPPIPAHVGG